jgi:hypothetical protein
MVILGFDKSLPLCEVTIGKGILDVKMILPPPGAAVFFPGAPGGHRW